MSRGVNVFKIKNQMYNQFYSNIDKRKDDAPRNFNREQRRREKKIDKMIKRKQWKYIFDEIKPGFINLTLEQTKEDCLREVSKSTRAIRYVMVQDDELCLESIKHSRWSMEYIRIPLKKETLVMIDLLYGSEIMRDDSLEKLYNKLLRLEKRECDG